MEKTYVDNIIVVIRAYQKITPKEEGKELADFLLSGKPDENIIAMFGLMTLILAAIPKLLVHLTMAATRTAAGFED